MTGLMWRHLKCTLLLLSSKNSLSSLTPSSLVRENTWKISYIVCTPSWCPEERWSVRLSTIASTLSSTRPSNSMELLSCWIFWPVLFLVSQCPWERSTLFSSRMSSFLFIRCRPAISSTNTSCAAPCSSWPRTHLWVSSSWTDSLNTGPSPTPPRRSCSFLSWLKCWRLARSKGLSPIFLRSSRD